MENKLPNAWVISNIEDSIEILDNQRKPVSTTERSKRLGDIPYYGATGIAGKIDDYIFDEELVLLGEDGAPFLDYSKNVAYLISGKSWVNNHAHVLKAKSNLTTNLFLLHYLNQFDYTNYVGGTTRLKLNQGSLKSIPFPLPPLAEQQRIVAKLDELFNHLEVLKTRLNTIPQLLKNFRQAVLTQAVTGKLTEEWRVGKALEEIDYVTIHNKRIIEFNEQKKENKKKGLKPPNKPEFLNHKIDEVKSFEVPSWCVAPIGFLSDCIVPGRDKPKSFTGNIPWITTPDLNSDLIYSSNAKLSLSKAEVLEVRAKIIPKNSVVISIVGRFGVSCVIKDACVINQQLHAFLPTEFLLPEYLMYYFKTQEGVMNSISTSTTIAYINKTKANSILVNVPSKEEQTEIVKRVEALFAKADNIETQYQSLKTKIDSLPQAILAKAFKGELVAQLPTDGDAKALLEEIKKLKASLRGTKQSVKRKTKTTN